MLLFFVSADQGLVWVPSGTTVHEWVHDARHLLGYPCHRPVVEMTARAFLVRRLLWAVLGVGLAGLVGHLHTQQAAIVAPRELAAGL